jgi:hypothetical protein
MVVLIPIMFMQRVDVERTLIMSICVSISLMVLQIYFIVPI